VRLLIFGSRGQLGRELTALCAANDVEMTSAARSECDISIKAQVHALLRTSRPTAVINAAAYTKVDKAEEESALAYLANRDGPRILAEACADGKIPLIHVSTDYVFDGTKSSPYRESDPVAPLNVYGSSKEAGEQAVRAVLEQHMIVRTAWVYGAHGNNFLKTMLNLAATRDTWGVVHDQIGTPTATIDLACALLAAARSAAQPDAPWGTYHFAGQGEATWLQFANEIVAAQARLTGRTPTLKPIATEEYPTPARRPRNSRLDSDRFVLAFGVRARPWQERTRAVVEALLGSS
jgi:dTDP-4-dehydrorhamnose reductase